MIGALALRVAGLDFGLPMAEARPDELTVAFQAMKFGTGDLNPHSFNYPSLFKYVVFVLFGAYYAVGKAIGEFAGKDAFLLAFFDGAVTFRLIVRAFSAVMGTAAVALLLRAPGGVYGASLLAVAFLAVRDSHFGVTDTTMVTLATAAALACLAQDGSRRRAVLAGVLAGLATSTKYNAALLAVPIAIALRHEPRLLLTAAVAMVGAFVATSPFVVLDFATFRKDFLYEASHLAKGHYVDVGGGWIHHVTHSLRYGVGLPILVAGVVGLAAWTRREGWVLVAFPLAYYLAIGRGETAFFRYALPLVPFLCMGAGWLIERWARPRALWLALVAAPTLWATLQADRLFMAGDTRDAMGRWIEANVPGDSVIVHAGAYTGAPMLQRNVANQTREYLAKQGRADASGFRKPDDPRWYNHARPAYDVQFVRKDGIDFASQVDVAALAADPPPWLEVEESCLVHYSHVPDEVRALLSRYEAVHAERSHERCAAVFDQQDAFYMPASRFTEFTRMGPNLTLYRRLE
ncbi:MAG: glycosyltransferase family 39 protein [Myxococcota bacterium]